MERGDIYWVDLPIPRGSEPGYRRPMLVVQSTFLNRSRLPTVMVCPLTANLKQAAFPGNVLIKAKESGLGKDSVVVVHQVMTINRDDLGEQAGSIPGHVMLAVNEGLGGSLELL